MHRKWVPSHLGGRTHCTGAAPFSLLALGAACGGQGRDGLDTPAVHHVGDYHLSLSIWGGIVVRDCGLSLREPMCQKRVGVRPKSERLTVRCFRETPFLLSKVTFNSFRESVLTRSILWDEQ